MLKKMMTIATAFVAALAFNTAVSSPAQAAGQNTVVNHSDSNGPLTNISISKVDPYVYSFTLYPGYQSNVVSCFRPSGDMHSAWGGIYYAGVVRCFSSSGNTLPLYGGRS